MGGIDIHIAICLMLTLRRWTDLFYAVELNDVYYIYDLDEKS